MIPINIFGQHKPGGPCILRARRLLFLLAVILILCSSTSAQVETASISGVITDQSGGIVVGAEVIITNADTNISSTSSSNKSGVYLVTGLKPGRYRIHVAKDGFKGIDLTDLILNVQDSISRNFALQVGSASETVTVDGSGLQINTTDAAVGTVVDHNYVENMPLNGRSFQDLLLLTPGVVLTQATSAEPGQFSVSGQRADANYFSVDGASANIGIGRNFLGQSAGGALPGFTAQGGTNSLVSVDALQEFRVQTSTFAPEFGRGPGGQVSIVTRSGANDFHGTLFDYFRNDALDANNWFNTSVAPALPKPAERQNDFGGVVGGRIMKDKTFFFFSYEGLRLRQPKSAQTLVPSNSLRQTAPSQMQPFLNALPSPNGPEILDSSGNPTGFSPFNASYSDPSTLNAYSIRIDHIITSRLNIFGRYNDAPSQVSSRQLGALSNLAISHVDVQTMTIGLNAGLSKSLNEELRANYSNVKNSAVGAFDRFGGATPPPDSILFPSGFSSANGILELFLGGGALGYSVGKGGTGEQRQLNIVDNLSATVKRHNLKFGVDYRWLAPFNSPSAYTQFALFFSNASVLSGNVDFASISANGGNALLDRNYSLYGQDTWRISPRLSLTYGIRWDVNPPLKGKTASNDPFTVQGLSNPATMTLAPRGTPLYATTYGNIAPRVGVAYQIRQSQSRMTILRAGGGIFYDLGSGSLGSVTSGFPYTASGPLLFGVPFPLTAQQAAPPSFSLTPPVASLFVTDPGLKLPRTYQWNVALEQALGSKQALSATYVGAIGEDLLRPNLLISPNSSFTDQVTVTTNAGSSSYESFQVQFQRTVAKGLGTVASYTLAHSIDDASRDSGVFSVPGVSSDRGSSDFDVRHSFTGALNYDVPTPGLGRPVRAILGGWSLNGFVTARTAPPVDLVGRNSIVIGGAQVAVRPNLVVGQPFYLYGEQYPGGKIFNPAAFTAPPAGTLGDLGRNVVRGFGAWQADFAVRRQFYLTERFHLQFRTEFFNIFNHPNFGSPTNNNIIGRPLFGRATQMLADSLALAGGFNSLYQIGGPRSIQLALKLTF